MIREQRDALYALMPGWPVRSAPASRAATPDRGRVTRDSPRRRRPARFHRGARCSVRGSGDRLSAGPGCSAASARSTANSSQNWTDAAGDKHSERLGTHAAAVRHLARSQAGGLRFHELHHSYATRLIDDGVPPNMVQRVMGHERSSTTLDLYTRRTDNSDRILRALTDPDFGETDADSGATPVWSAGRSVPRSRLRRRPDRGLDRSRPCPRTPHRRPEQFDAAPLPLVACGL